MSETETTDMDENKQGQTSADIKADTVHVTEDSGETDESSGQNAKTTDGTVNDTVIQGAEPDLKLAEDRGIDVHAPTLGLKVASERLSIVRYVFLVQVEDGIATAPQRAALEYADAVLIGWPGTDSDEIVTLDETQRQRMIGLLSEMEECITAFRSQETKSDVEAMADSLVHATEAVSQIRRMYQPDFPLPTFAEIRRVVQDEWDDDMDKIDSSQESGTTVEAIEQQTEQADERRKGDESGAVEVKKEKKA